MTHLFNLVQFVIYVHSCWYLSRIAGQKNNVTGRYLPNERPLQAKALAQHDDHHQQDALARRRDHSHRRLVGPRASQREGVRRALARWRPDPALVAAHRYPSGRARLARLRRRRRGHGDSEWAADGDYTTEAYARDLVSMVDAIGEAPVLVGASMGGMAALIAQADHPGLSRALVLVDVVPTAEPAGLTKITGFLERGLAGFDTLEDALAAVVAYNPHRRRPPRLDGLRKNLRERDGRWYWHWDPQLLSDRKKTLDTATAREIRARAAARTITVPTLLIRGAQSDIVSAQGARELLELIPGSRHVDVSGAGHMVSGDDNDVLSEGLLGFLSEI